MKAIIVTQDLKDKNDIFSRREVGEIYITSNLPNKFIASEMTLGGYPLRTDLHEVDGWKDVVRPETLENERLENLHFDEVQSVFTYDVVAIPDEEIQQKKIFESSIRKQEKLREIQENKIVDEYKALETESELLEVQDIFPVWEAGMELEIGDKIQHFKDNELVLFRVEQAHTTQSDWKPVDNPALFTRIGYDGEVLEWQQPTGAQDAYNTGDRVLFEGKTYESTIDANTWSPTEYPQGWTEIL